jgi:hypothetical protein
MKRLWQPMELRPVGRISQLLRGENGSNFDPGHSNNTKKGGG